VRGALLNCGRAEKKEGRRKRVRFLFCCGWKRGMRGEEGKYIYIYTEREGERERTRLGSTSDVLTCC
jgi:hypothetical protein